MLNHDQPGANRTSVGLCQSPNFLHRSRLVTYFVPSLTFDEQARFFGSQNHTISPFKAAIAAVHLILVPLIFVSNDNSKHPVRYGARANWWGHEYISTSPVKEWVSHQAESAALVEKCDVLYAKMKKAHVTSTDS